ncbi:transposase [Streptosporangium sp. OZ121]|uniref:transposase n=1 Tax=Streptosporangium sp. OZ121 TaxID=3444183 RepID=UPI003F7A1CF0
MLVELQERLGSGCGSSSGRLIAHATSGRRRYSYDRTAFTIDWDSRQAICPQGQRSTGWSPCRQRGGEAIVVTFPTALCRPCPARPLCTTGKKDRRQITIRP